MYSENMCIEQTAYQKLHSTFVWETVKKYESIP